MADNKNNETFDIMKKRRSAPQASHSNPKPHVVDFDEIDPENARIRKQKQLKRTAKKGGNAALSLAKAISYIVIVFTVSIILSCTIIFTCNDIFAFVKDDVSTTIEIPEDAGVYEVARILEKNGIIKYPLVFTLYCHKEFSGSSYYTGEFKPGEHTLVFKNEADETEKDKNTVSFIQLEKSEDKALLPLNYDRIISALAVSQYKKREEVRVTIPEGFTVDEIITLLVKSGVGVREKYIDVINNYDYDYKFVDNIKMSPERKYRLEGYLFPDTYDFFTDESEISVINKFLMNFEKKFEDIYYERARELGYTTDEVIILASILEKEAKYAKDLSMMSSVFHNRLKSSYKKLESDATVLYVKDDYETNEQLATSKYNSYNTVGFIPGPISNPGFEAISAAFYPDKTSYMYFFSYKDGSTKYSKTLQEHQNAVAKAKAEGKYATQE
jgi:UPF0755 protein